MSVVRPGKAQCDSEKCNNRSFPSLPMTTPRRPIRPKCANFDEQLAIEYKQLRDYSNHDVAPLLKAHIDTKDAILKQLGKDRLEFLLFKMKTEERLEKIEATQQEIMTQLFVFSNKTWYQRLFS